MSESIFLRPLVLEDAKTSYKWRNNPDVWKFTFFNPKAPITLNAEVEWLEKVLDKKDQKRFAICLTKNEKYIGNVQLINILDQTAEFHLFIGNPEYWGKGIGEKAAKHILDYAFFTLKLNKVRLDVHKENKSAIKIYERHGFFYVSSNKSFMEMELSAEDYKGKYESSGTRHIVKLEQEDRWRGLVKRAIRYDFYHSWTYNLLDNSSGIPMLFVYEKGSDFIAIPLVKREIEDSEYFDMSSVYGYSGPISNKDFAELPTEFVASFRADFLDFLKEEKVVTVFSRLNPFLSQLSLMEGFGGVVDNGKVVVLDLSKSIEDQRKGYQERLFRKIKQLRRKGYYVKEANSVEDIRIFKSIYTSNMHRLAASDSYYFDEAYFRRLLDSEEYDARLVFVYDHNDYPVCGGIVVVTNGIMQAHLLGTREDYLKDSPAKLLTEEITIIGRKLGVKYYNLGGGLGFKEDSLFRWKANFSSLTFGYQSWRFVVNPEVYTSLLSQQEIDLSSEIDFFPLYRFQVNKA
nr:GNAT family N-acetyltransferase [Pedobacter panaciterrae]